MDHTRLSHVPVGGPSPEGDAQGDSPIRDRRPLKVAILGTGKMGSAIAARLSAAGFDVVLWNRTRSRAEALGIGTVADYVR